MPKIPVSNRPQSPSDTVRRSRRQPKKRALSPDWDTSHSGGAAEPLPKRRAGLRGATLSDGSWSGDFTASLSDGDGAISGDRLAANPAAAAARSGRLTPESALRTPALPTLRTLPGPNAAPVTIVWPAIAPAAPSPPPPPPPLWSLAAKTPGGSAWWKQWHLFPGNLHDVYVNSDPLYRNVHHTLPDVPFVTAMRLAAHRADAKTLVNIVNEAQQTLQEKQYARFGADLEHMETPTIEEIDAVNKAVLFVRTLRLHAIVHVLVGSAPIKEKLLALEALRNAQDILGEVRMAGLNLLHIACIAEMPARERAPLIRYLRHMGVDPLATDADGTTPLHCLAAQPDAAQAMASLLAMPLPLDAGSAVNARNAAGETPLFVAYAAQPENADAIRWLTSKGADVRQLTREGYNMAHAVWFHGNHPEVLGALLQQLTDLEPSRPRTPWRPRLGTTPATAIPEPGPLVVPQV